MKQKGRGCGVEWRGLRQALTRCVGQHYPFRVRTRTRTATRTRTRTRARARTSRKFTHSSASGLLSFPRAGTQTDKFQRLLQSIWHQVATAGEVFVIGELLDDQTVKGGTGWGAELARHFKKRLYVFDQKKTQWFQWSQEASRWNAIEPPRIGKTRFCGTGTRELTDAGRDAVNALFDASFGQG